MYLRKCIENHAIFQKYKRQKHCMFKVIFPKVPSQNKENKVSYLGISDEFELKFPELSRAELKSRTELGHSNFRAETELDFF